jgi:putative NIF3 family GTP cyclohydrolase 1 type 2
VAYDIYPLELHYTQVGAGMIGELEQGLDLTNLLSRIKERLGGPVIRYSGAARDRIKTVACCGGSGSFLIPQAVASGADAFITGDIKYHQFIDAADKLIIIDAGHFETEQYTTEIFYEFLMKKFPTFAIRFSKMNTNPIKYF